MDTKRDKEIEKMKRRCISCGRKEYLYKGLCFRCKVLYVTAKSEMDAHISEEQQKINEGLFQMILLQQDIMDELVKHIDNDAITQDITARREIYERCHGAGIKDRYRRWKEGL